MNGRCAATWWGHAAVRLQMDEITLVTDPLLRRHVGPLHSTGHRPDPTELAAVDVVLLSHLHRDHTDLRSLAQLPAGTRYVVPVGAGRLVRRRARGPVQELAPGEETTVGPVTVRATPAEHDGRRHFRGPYATPVGFLLIGSRRVYFAGDTDLFPGMAQLPRSAGGALDLALLPVSGWGLTLGAGHLDAERAARAVALTRPTLAIPIHWGTLRLPLLWRARAGHSRKAAARFTARVAQLAPDTRVAVPAPGEPVTVPRAPRHV